VLTSERFRASLPLRRETPMSLDSGSDGTTGGPPLPGRIGHFRPLSIAGSGGVGVVYLAEDLEIPDRKVALKVLKPGFFSEVDLETLRSEAEALATAHHPHVVVIHEIGESPEGAFMACEYLSGGTLMDRIQTGPIPLSSALRYARDAGDALRTAHGRGVLHRDFKPANIFLSENDQVKVGDFGLAIRVTHPPPIGAISEQTTVSRQRPATIPLAGTPGYLAPELFTGGRPSYASDQYSFGITLHQLVAGRHPQEGLGGIEVTTGRMRMASSIPSDLLRIMRRCVSPEPNDRFSSMGEVVEALDQARKKRDPQRRRFRIVLAAGVVILALPALGLWWADTRKVQRALALNDEGIAELKAGNRDGARRAFIAAHRIAPANMQTCANLGTLALSEENPGWAVALLSDCAAAFPDSAPVLYNLGAAVRTIGQPALAAERLHEALKKADGDEINTLIVNELALALIDAGRAAEAVGVFGCCTWPPSNMLDGALIRRTRGLALLRSGRPAEAIGFLSEALQGPLDPSKRAAVNVWLGQSLAEVGDRHKALSAFSEALRLGAAPEIEEQARIGLQRLGELDHNDSTP